MSMETNNSWPQKTETHNSTPDWQDSVILSVYIDTQKLKEGEEEIKETQTGSIPGKPNRSLCLTYS